MGKETFLQKLPYLLIMYFTIAYSGVTNVILWGETALIYFLIGLYILKRPKIKVNGLTLFWMAYIMIIVLLQDMAYGGGLQISNVILWGVKLILPLFIATLLKDRFVDLFIEIMVLISVVSLFIFIILQIFPRMGNLFLYIGTPADKINSVFSTIIYSYRIPTPGAGFQFIERLYGPFHEPGMYGVFLIFAMIFNYMGKRTFFNTKGVLFLICLLLTQSTAAYIALLLVFVYSVYLTRYRLLSWVFLAIVLVGSIYAYRLPFIKDKIEYDRYVASTSSLEEARRGRTHQATKSVYAFGRHMIFGAGITSESEQGLAAADISGFSVLDIGRRTGLAGFMLYVLGLFSCIYYYQKKYLYNVSYVAVMILIIPIFIVISSQQVAMLRPFILTLIFHGLLNFKQIGLKTANVTPGIPANLQT